MTSPQFAYIWRYEVDADHAVAFRKSYAADGDWALLMARHPGYVETRLLQDANDPNRYVTIDYWQTQADRDDFRQAFASEYDALDRACATYTVSERFVGDFAILPADDS